MSLLEGIDYTVRCLPFPNYASEALVLSSGDGSYQILLNSRYPEEVLRARLEHELSHLRADHLYQSERPIAEREAEAEGRPAPPAPPAGTTPCRPPDGCEPSLQSAPAPCHSEPPTDPRRSVPPYRPSGGGYFASWSRAIKWARAQQKALTQTR